jgi:Putative peptidoglycan binding domain/LysM domain
MQWLEHDMRRAVATRLAQAGCDAAIGQDRATLEALGRTRAVAEMKRATLSPAITGAPAWYVVYKAIQSFPHDARRSQSPRRAEARWGLTARAACGALLRHAMSYYTVQQSDCLSSIAAKFGFASYRLIYDHSNNAEFKVKRPNPNLIYPGDVLFIPDKEVKALAVPTGSLHRFKLRTSKTRLRLVLTNMGGERLAGLAYTLTVGGSVREGTTGGDGMIDEPIPPDASSAQLSLKDGKIVKQLVLGALDPIDTVSGYQARLRNLGYACGPVDGVAGPLTARGVRAFQDDHPPLEVDGICGPKTQAVLLDEYGC